MADKPDTAGVIAPPPLIALAAIVLGLLLDRLMPAYVLTVLLSPAERIVIGTILMAAGATLGVSAIRAFTRADTYVEPWKPSTALVTRDVFGWLRNPMYVGAIKREERYLEAKFGEAYRAYRLKVRRYGWPPF
jgi:protein-S-isoprenylcysteine O-methyltransferase Ste14